MRAFVAALVMGASLMTADALAQTRTPPSSLVLTRAQWQCLATRMRNLERVRSNLVRVPLSPCGRGPRIRGPGVGNPTVGAGNPTIETYQGQPVTTGPLYLTKRQLACVRERLPELSQDEAAILEFETCD